MLNEIGSNNISSTGLQGEMPPPANILLVEDNEMDIEIFRRAVRKMGLSYPVTIAHDGIEALDALRGNGETTPLARPSLVLLDLHMPRMNGHEFLDQVRSDPNLKDLVVFVLTTSDAPQDIDRAYDHNVAGYMLKSISGSSVGDALQLIDRFAHLVELPS